MSFSVHMCPFLPALGIPVPSPGFIVLLASVLLFASSPTTPLTTLSLYVPKPSHILLGQASSIMAKAKAKSQASPKVKTATRKGPEQASAQETCMACKMMSLQNRATIDDIVNLLKATPSMIMPTYKLLSKKLLVPLESGCDTRAFLPENNTRIKNISNTSLRPIVKAINQNLTDEVLDSLKASEPNIEKQIFHFATGADPEDLIFNRHRDTFTAAYVELARTLCKGRAANLDLASGSLDWSSQGVFELEDSMLVHKSTGTKAKLPNIVSKCMDDWKLLDNYCEHSAYFYNEAEDMVVKAKKHADLRGFKFKADLSMLASPKKDDLDDMKAFKQEPTGRGTPRKLLE